MSVPLTNLLFLKTGKAREINKMQLHQAWKIINEPSKHIFFSTPDGYLCTPEWCRALRIIDLNLRKDSKTRMKADRSVIVRKYVGKPQKPFIVGRPYGIVIDYREKSVEIQLVGTDYRKTYKNMEELSKEWVPF